MQTSLEDRRLIDRKLTDAHKTEAFEIYAFAKSGSSWAACIIFEGDVAKYLAQDSTDGSI